MQPTLHVHFWNFGSELAFSKDGLYDEIKDVLPEEMDLETISDYNSRFGHLLPDGVGGDDFGFIQVVEFVVGFGTVDAFKLFAASFLGRAGYLLADRLFKPMSREQREAALAMEKAQRSRWREHLEGRRGEDADWLREWGEKAEALSLDEHHGSYTIKIYIEETKEEHSIRFVYKRRDNSDYDGRTMEQDVRQPHERDKVFRRTIATYTLAETPEEFAEIIRKRLREIVSEIE